MILLKNTEVCRKKLILTVFTVVGIFCVGVFVVGFFAVGVFVGGVFYVSVFLLSVLFTCRCFCCRCYLRVGVIVVGVIYVSVLLLSVFFRRCFDCRCFCVGVLTHYGTVGLHSTFKEQSILHMNHVLQPRFDQTSRSCEFLKDFIFEYMRKGGKCCG